MDPASVRCLLLLLAVTSVHAVKDVAYVKYVTTWTAWSGWSACAPCGQSTIRRYRECVGQLEDHTVFRVKTEECPGINRTYKICERKPCVRRPTSSREYQCYQKSREGQVPQHFRKVVWNPYIVDAYPCELFCQPEGFNNFWSFGDVTDNSECRTIQSKDGVCIKGKCLEVGCDGATLSKATLDMCLICGGENRSCNYISDEFREVKPPGKLGYSDVVTLPKGATNVDITDSKNVIATQLYVHENILGLQDSSKFYLLNSYRWYGFNGPLKLAGAAVKFYFTKDGEKSVHIVGPLIEPLLVMVLQTNPYLHLKYGYWLSDAARQLQRDSQPEPKTTSATKAASYQLRALGYASRTKVKSEDKKTDDNEVTLERKERRRKYRKKKGSKGQKCLSRPRDVDGKIIKFKSKLAKLQYIYCQSEFVGIVTIVSKRRYRRETQYEVDLKSTFKNSVSMVKREFLWRDKNCRGVKLRTGKDYFVMIRTRTDMKKRLTRFTIDEESFVRKYTEKSGRLLRAAVSGVKCNRR